MKGAPEKNVIESPILKKVLQSLSIDGDLAAARGLIEQGVPSRPLDCLFLGIHSLHFIGLEHLKIEDFKTQIEQNPRNFPKLENQCKLAELFLLNPNSHLDTVLNTLPTDNKRFLPFFAWLAKNNRHDLLEREYFRKLFGLDLEAASKAFIIAAAFSSKEFLAAANKLRLLSAQDIEEICEVAAANGDNELLNVFFPISSNIDAHRIIQKSLFWAIRNGHTHTVKFLLKNGADIEADIDFAEDSYFMLATRCSAEITMLLIQEHHANVDRQDFSGDTALHSAAEKNNLTMMKILLAANASIEIKNKAGKRPLEGITNPSVREELQQFISCLTLEEVLKKQGQLHVVQFNQSKRSYKTENEEASQAITKKMKKH